MYLDIELKNLIRKGNSMIKANNLVKSFTKTVQKNKKIEFNAVDDISFEVKKGEIVGILGPNGAGKTTLLRMLAGLMTPSDGYVSVETDEGEIKGNNELKRHIGYLSANTKLYGRFSAKEILKFYGQVYGMTDEEIDKRTEEIVKVLDMEKFADNRIDKLSTGQMQRTSISRCLIHDPEIYIFDEPTLGLDILSSSAIIDFMKAEKEKGKTVIYSTHYMEEAEYMCDRIIMIHEGKIVCNNSPEDLKKETDSHNLREVFKKLIENRMESAANE